MFQNNFSINESTRIITGHVIYNPAYTYKFQLKTTKDENSHCYWYVELWEEFSKCKKTLQSEETNELMDIADDK